MVVIIVTAGCSDAVRVCASGASPAHAHIRTHLRWRTQPRRAHISRTQLKQIDNAQVSQAKIFIFVPSRFLTGAPGVSFL